jgi:hypothetical protein
MRTITHYQKVMWGLYCEYSHLQKKKWSTSYNLYNTDGEFQKTIVNNYERRSNEQWDFINAKFYYITKIDPIYEGTKKEFADYLEPYVTYWGGLRHKKSPYDETKPNTASPLRRWWRGYGWMLRRYPQRSKWQKRPSHVVKKVLSEEEIQKREWRKKVKDPRDQRFHKKYRGCKTDYKFYNKKGHRAFEKDCLNKGTYDKLHDRTWKHVEDWWSWD